MEIIFVIVSLGYLAIIVFLAITWYKDVKKKEDTDKRILVLEKRITEEHRGRKIELASFECGMLEHGESIEEIKKEVNKLEKRLPKNNK